MNDLTFFDSNKQESLMNKQESLMTFINKYFTSLNKSTCQNYIKGINDFLDFMNIGLNDLQKVSISDIRNWIDSLIKRNLDVKTIIVKLSAIKKIFKVIKPSFYEDIKNEYRDKLQAQNKKHNNDILSKNDIQILKNSITNYRDSLIFYFLYNQGCRVSEVLGIRLSDIDSEKLTVKILGKRNKQRELIITDAIYTKILALNPVDYIFTNKQGHRLTRQHVHKTIKNLGKKYIFKTIYPHFLRHVFATTLLNQNIAIAKVSKYLGHSNINTTIQSYYNDSINVDELNLL